MNICSEKPYCSEILASLKSWGNGILVTSFLPSFVVLENNIYYSFAEKYKATLNRVSYNKKMYAESLIERNNMREMEEYKICIEKGLIKEDGEDL